MRDSFGLAIRNEILSGALTVIAVAALDGLCELHSTPARQGAGLG